MIKRRKDRLSKTPAPAADRVGESGGGAPLLIVGVGASAGGLEAFMELLRHLPTGTGMGFVLVQHLDPKHESALVQLLARATSLPVTEVTNNLRVEANHVYVIPPNTNLSITRGVLKLQPRGQTRLPNRSIDSFFESLAEDQRERAIGVILSGTATDGTLGLEAIKGEGGITFAQDDSARYDSMPRSAEAAGCVDFILAPKAISQELARIAKHPRVADQTEHVRAPAEDARASATEDEGDATPLPSGGRGTPRTGARQARGGGPGERSAENGFKMILLLLRNHKGVDFSLYKPSTIQRRINRRMVLSRKTSLTSYADFLRGNSKELDALYSDALIGVTSFFRNPEAFDVLQRKVIPKLLKRRGDEPIRIWVLGCSTGQEAYSLAMLFAEAVEKTPRMRGLQVFATDLNEALLDKARHGLYTKSLAQDISPRRLRRFFVEEEGGYRISKSLREMVIFARQNLISDPPFSRMDLISCRNLLIYFEPSLQRRAFPAFHYALKPEGFLFLGASESIGGFTKLFDPVDRKQKIYARKATPTPSVHHSMEEERVKRSKLPPVGPPISNRAGYPPQGLGVELNAQREADRVTVNLFAPPGVLINAELEIVQFRGSTSAFFESPTGKASFDVLKMAREGLMLPLRAAINKAKRERKPARKEFVRVKQNGRTRTIHLEVVPLEHLRESWFLILFEDAEKTGRTVPSAPSPEAIETRGGRRAPGSIAKADLRHITELESDLAETRDYLRSIQEQHEAATEELQASNEEVQSANEELQSINEELETSKEELESTNEELTTVNEEMANRNAELNRLNSDLTNLQTSTNLAIVLLGRDLTIRRFSPRAEKEFGLLATDVGRSISQVRHDLAFEEGRPLPQRSRAGDGQGEGPPPLEPPESERSVPQTRALESFIAEVIDTVRERERDVRSKDGRSFSLRVRPYLTLDNKVDGAVLVLVDITDLKRSEEAIAGARDEAESILRTVPDPLLILDADLCVQSANEAFYTTFKLSPADAEGRSFYDLGKGQWDIRRLRHLLEDILPGRHSFNNFEVTHDFESIGRRTVLLNARRLEGTFEHPPRILLGIRDMTEVLASREAVREAGERFRFMAESMPQKIFTAKANGDMDYLNPQWTEYTGVPFEQIQAGGWPQFVHPDDVAENVRAWKHSIETGELFQLEHRFQRDDGVYRWHFSRAVPMRDAAGKITMWVGSNTDIHEQRQAANELRRLAADLSEADRRKNAFLAMLAHELRNPLAPISNAMQIFRLAEGDDRAIRSAAEVMERSVGQMVRLVDDLLDVNRVSLGKVELRKGRIELSSVVNDAVEAARPIFESMSHELTVTLPPEPVHLNADPVRLGQVVGNLLNNACKFTDNGGRISLAAEREGAQVVLRVRDNGIGIAADELPHVFEMFMQIDTSLERSRSGLGIGLMLVKTLVEMHDGTVEAHSDGLGHGSEFVVWLPLSDGTAGPAAPEPTANEPTVTAPRRILVVDDNRDSATSLAMVLELMGHETRTVHDGLGAVEAAASYRPDTILLDIGLPTLNGYEVARQIRQQPWGGAIQLVALTGWGQEEDRRKSNEAGFDHHLVKPVDHAALVKLLAESP